MADRFDEEAAEFAKEILGPWGRKLYAEGLAAGVKEGEAKLREQAHTIEDPFPCFCEYESGEHLPVPDSGRSGALLSNKCVWCALKEAEAKLCKVQEEAIDNAHDAANLYEGRCDLCQDEVEMREEAEAELAEAREALQEIRDREHGLQRCRNPEAHWDSCDHSEACQRAGKALAAKTADNRR